MPPGIPGLSRLAIDPMTPPHWLCLFMGHDTSWCGAPSRSQMKRAGVPLLGKPRSDPNSGRFLTIYGCPRSFVLDKDAGCLGPLSSFYCITAIPVEGNTGSAIRTCL